MPLHKALPIVTYVMVLWSFTALASTGELPPVTVGAMYLGIVASLFKHRVTWSIPRWMTAILTLLALGATILYCLPDPGLRLLTAVIHFFFFLEIVKLLARHPKAEDFLHIAIICFFQIVATAVSTQSWVFLIVVVGYIAQACVLLVLVNAGRDAEEVRRGYDCDMDLHRVGDATRRRMERVLSAQRSGTVTTNQLLRFAAPCGLIVLLAAGIFLVIPRFSAHRPFLGISKPRAVQTTGFSSDVDLQQMDQIYADPTIVMRVYPDQTAGEQFSPHPVYLRATSLDYFNNRRWSKSIFFPRQSGITARNFEFFTPPARYPLREVSGRITSENPRLGHAFAIDFPLEFNFERSLSALKDDQAYSLKFESQIHQQLFEYRFRSLEIRSSLELYNMLITERDARNIGGSDDPEMAQAIPEPRERRVRRMPDLYRKYYLQLPAEPGVASVTTRISELALSILKPEDNDLANAIRLQNYLATQYKYTLDLRRLGGGDPLEQFLFERKEGHCELFATALAQMLRSVNIPARMVSGYLTDEWNNFGRYYVVREYNAHAWVEAWIENIGWVRFDPTPAGAVFSGGQKNPLLATISHYVDSFRIHWYRYVIDYDLGDQQSLVTRMYRVQIGKIAVGEPLARAGEKFSKLLTAFTGAETTRVNRKALYLLMAATGLFLIFLGGGLWQILHGIWRRRRAAGRRDSQRSIVEFYYRILDRLKRRGLERQPFQTAGEFAFETVVHDRRLAMFPEITRIYYRVRYSGQPTPTPEESLLIGDFFKNLD